MASSPATVGALSVSDSALAPVAMVVAAAIVFITVFGKIKAESPEGPDVR